MNLLAKILASLNRFWLLLHIFTLSDITMANSIAILDKARSGVGIQSRYITLPILFSRIHAYSPPSTATLLCSIKCTYQQEFTRSSIGGKLQFKMSMT
jgi:hypothetical protein